VKLKLNCTHTNSRMWLKTHVGYFIHRTIENRFCSTLFFYFFTKKPYNSTTNFLPMRK
jgi:hypothetical protein